jgi:hypothetical protein
VTIILNIQVAGDRDPCTYVGTSASGNDGGVCAVTQSKPRLLWPNEGLASAYLAGNCLLSMGGQLNHEEPFSGDATLYNAIAHYRTVDRHTPTGAPGVTLAMVGIARAYTTMVLPCEATGEYLALERRTRQVGRRTADWGRFLASLEADASITFAQVRPVLYLLSAVGCLLSTVLSAICCMLSAVC